MQGAEEEAVQAVQVLELDAEPASVGRARQFVAEWIGRSGREALGPDASLVVSELVSNAVIHARTTLEVRVRPLHDGARIEVRDGVERGIAPARHDEGRGLGLRVVARLASRWGVDPMPDGKVVWAELGSVRAGGTDGPELGLGPAPLPLPDDWPEVRLADVPTRLLRGWEGHIGELIREFSLVAPAALHATDPAAAAGFDAGPEDRVVAVKDVLERFWDLIRSVWAQAHAAGDRFTGRVTVVTRVPERIVLDGPRFLEALEEADALSREDRLLTAPTPEEVADFGRWFVDAVVRQVVDGPAAVGARCPFPA